MATRMVKPWLALNRENALRLPGHLGIFQLANDAGEIVYIGCADARTRFGLREVVTQALDEDIAGASQFRTESTMAYHSRVRELLQIHLHDHGILPGTNTGLDASRLGRIRPG